MYSRCKICGVEYEHCYSCEKVNSWRMHTDTAEHYYIFCVLMAYQVDHDAKKAYKALRKRGVDFFATEGYVANVKQLLEEIYTLSHNIAKKKEDVAEAEEIVLQENIQNFSEETESVEEEV